MYYIATGRRFITGPIKILIMFPNTQLVQLDQIKSFALTTECDLLLWRNHI